MELLNKTKKSWKSWWDIYDEEDASDDEKYIKEIVSNAVLKDNIEKVIVPITGASEDDYLLIDRENQLFISIEDGEVNISNHDFLYKKKFNPIFTKTLKKVVKDKLAEERRLLKESLFENEIGLLEKIRNIYQ